MIMVQHRKHLCSRVTFAALIITCTALLIGKCAMYRQSAAVEVSVQNECGLYLRVVLMSSVHGTSFFISYTCILVAKFRSCNFSLLDLHRLHLQL